MFVTRFVGLARRRALRTLLAVAAGLAPAVVPAQLTDLGSSQLDQCSGPETCEDDDDFGNAVVAGDFDGDGFDDLAVGASGETTNGKSGAGLVQVFYGSEAGLLTDQGQVFTQETSHVPGSSETNDHFGAALAAGDLDGDGFDDLAIGVPYEDIGEVVDAGMVVLLFGSASGLSGTGALEWDQSNLPTKSPGCGSDVSESPETADHFGYSVAIGAPAGFTHRLVIGVPGEDGFLFGQGDAGEVVELSFYDWVAHPRGETCNSFQDNFATCSGADGAEGGDQFGRAVAARLYAVGDPQSIGGAPFEETAAGVSDSGVVDAYGACFQQNGSLADSEESGDRYGGALTLGDFDDDGFQDLAVGIAGEGIESAGVDEAGAVSIVYANAGDDLSTSGNQFFSQNNLTPAASPGEGDHFGAALAAGDFDGDGRTDLAVGAPDDNPGGHDNAGEVNILYSAGASGLSVVGSQEFDQDHPSAVPSVAEANDNFGQALAAGDFDGNGVDDLAVGVPGETGAATHEGVVDVLYGFDRSTGAFGTVSFGTSTQTVSEHATVVVIVHRTGGAVLSASVDHSVTGGTATEGVDYSYTDGTFTWNAGDLSSDVKIFPIHDDSADEPNETIVLHLSNPSPGVAIVSPSTMTITITDDDPAGQIFADGFEGGDAGEWTALVP